MNTAGALILGTFVAIGATSAFGQEQLPEDAGTNHRFGASSASVAPEPDDRQSRPLFKIGGLPVHVYAPRRASVQRGGEPEPRGGPVMGAAF